MSTHTQNYGDTHTRGLGKENRDFGDEAGRLPCPVLSCVTCRQTKTRLFSGPDSCNYTSLPNGGHHYLRRKDGWDIRSSVNCGHARRTGHPHCHSVNKGDSCFSHSFTRRPLTTLYCNSGKKKNKRLWLSVWHWPKCVQGHKIKPVLLWYNLNSINLVWQHKAQSNAKLTSIKIIHTPAIFLVFDTAADIKSSSLASLHKGIKAEQLEARLRASCLAISSDVTCEGSGN